MLRWTLIFLIVAVISAALGFGLVGDMAFLAARVSFFVFLVLFVVALVHGRSLRAQ